MDALAAHPQPNPVEVAEELIDSHPPEWIDAFSEALQRQRMGGALRRVLQTWDLSQSEAARRFGVSRQSVAKWLSSGVPANRASAVAELSAATDLLEHYLKHDRIPGVVRRPAMALGGRSLLDLLEADTKGGVLDACRAMFDFARAQG